MFNVLSSLFRNSGPIDDSALEDQYLDGLDDALSLIPAAEKLDLMRALHQTPLLVTTESRPLKFLRRDAFNFNAAARRLCQYWFYRRKLFGDRAFLPMTITGSGAMSEQDVEAFSHGCFVIVGYENSALPTIMVNRGQGMLKMSPLAMSRCTFYCLSVLSENDRAATDGVMYLALLDRFLIDGNSRENLKIVRDALPIVVRNAHLFYNPPEPTPMISIVLKIMNLVGTTIFNRTLVHSNLSPLVIKAKLLSFGIQESDIPVFFGGSFNEEKFNAWFRERMALEWNIRHAFVPPSTAIQLPFQPIPSVNTTKNCINEQSCEPLILEQLENFLKPTDFGQAELLQHHSKKNTAVSTERTYSIPLLRHMILTGKAVTYQGFSSRDEGTLPSTLWSSLPTNSPSNITTFDPNSAIARLARQIKVSSCLSQLSNNDIYIQFGIAPSRQIQETDAILKLGRLAVEEALQTMPRVRIGAYIQALQHCPMLVHKESPVFHFLRRDNFDPLAAAARLASYWRLRVELFGSNAFLGLNQSGHGALSRDDLVVLSSGVYAVLPKDNSNRGVIVDDRNRSLENTVESVQSKLRTLFYLLSVLSEDPVNQLDGIVWLSSLVSPRLTEINKEYMAKCLDILEVMPIRIKAWHLFVIPPKTAKKAQTELILSRVAYSLVTKYGKRVLLHTGDSTETLLKKIVKFGMSDNNVPAVLGGSWRYEEYTKWLKKRGQLELESVAAVAASISIGSALAGAEILVMNVKTEKHLSVEERKERKRKLNIIHSRQKRERRKVEAQGLMQQKSTLEDENAKLKVANAQLEAKLAEARRIILSHPNLHTSAQ